MLMISYLCYFSKLVTFRIHFMTGDMVTWKSEGTLNNDIIIEDLDCITVYVVELGLSVFPLIYAYQQYFMRCTLLLFWCVHVGLGLSKYNNVHANLGLFDIVSRKDRIANEDRKLFVLQRREAVRALCTLVFDSIYDSALILMLWQDMTQMLYVIKSSTYL